MKSAKPIERRTSLKPLSREHHHGLLLSWKIREGLKQNIQPARIKKYTDWFWKNHLQPHFEFEEKHVFPILDESHEMVSRAKEEHTRLKGLFTSAESIEFNLSLIEKALDAHIRYEERVVFNEIQKIADEKQLALLGASYEETPNSENWKDKFWVKIKKSSK